MQCQRHASIHVVVYSVDSKTAWSFTSVADATNTIVTWTYVQEQESSQIDVQLKQLHLCPSPPRNGHYAVRNRKAALLVSIHSIPDPRHQGIRGIGARNPPKDTKRSYEGATFSNRDSKNNRYGISRCS